MNETLKQVLTLLAYFVSGIIIYLALRYLSDVAERYYQKRENGITKQN